MNFNAMDPSITKESVPKFRQLTPALQEKANQELNEVPERLESDIIALRDWIKKEPHLRARTSDQFLISFLRGSKFSLEKAKKKIDRYYTLKAAIPEIFNDRRNVDDAMVLEIIRLGVILQIQLDPEDTGPAITIIRVGSYDTKKYKFSDVVRVGSMFGEIMMLEDDNSNVSGYIEIMDMSNITASHLFQLQPDLLRNLSMFADEAMPMRQRGIHFINVPTAFETAFNSLRTLFPAATMKRISVSSSFESLKAIIPLKSLPKEYGGDNGNFQDIINRMEEKILRYRDYFAEEHNFGTDEKLRENGQRTCYKKFLGIEGSFRKLDVD